MSIANQSLLASVSISDFFTGVNTSGYSDANTLIAGKVTTALNYFIGFSALVAVILLIVAGYMFITASGDAEKIGNAQKAVTAAIVGMVIVFIARILVQFVLQLILGS